MTPNSRGRYLATTHAKALASRLCWSLLALAASGFLGCATPVARELPPEGASIYQVPPPARDYRLMRGDRVRISFFKGYTQEGPYHLETGDRIKVMVESRSELTHESEILPDGTVTLPLVGPVQMRGKTVAEANAYLEEEYQAHLSRPSVDVLVTEPRGRVEDFFEALLASSKGASRESDVTHDGTVEFPLIEPVPAAGRTISETSRAIQEAYAVVLPHVHVEVVLLHSQPIAVLGEVVTGGVFESAYPMTALRALALAGGPTIRARMSEVLLIRQLPNGEPSVTVLDLKSFLDGKGAGDAGVPLIGNDVLYVPLKRISKMNVFIDQYFRRMWPVETGFGLGWALNN